MEAKEVRCPSCSAPAPASEGVSTCRFCGATLAIAAPAPARAPKRESVGAPVSLEEVGPNPLEVIKVLREHTGLGLQEVKALIDAAPCVVADWPGEPTRLVVLYFDLWRAGARAR